MCGAPARETCSVARVKRFGYSGIIVHAVSCGNRFRASFGSCYWQSLQQSAVSKSNSFQHQEIRKQSAVSFSYSTSSQQISNRYSFSNQQTAKSSAISFSGVPWEGWFGGSWDSVGLRNFVGDRCCGSVWGGEQSCLPLLQPAVLRRCKELNFVMAPRMATHLGIGYNGTLAHHN